MKSGRLLPSLLRRKDGGATVEFVIWIPFFFVIFGIVTDVSLIMNMRARMFAAANDAARAVALSRMSLAEAQAFALERFGPGAAQMQSSVSVQDGFVTAQLSTTFSQPMIFGDDFLFGNGLVPEQPLRAAMTMVLEQTALDALENDTCAGAMCPGQGEDGLGDGGGDGGDGDGQPDVELN